MQDQPPPTAPDTVPPDQASVDRVVIEQASLTPEPAEAMPGVVARVPLSKRVRLAIAVSMLLHGLALVAVLVPWPMRAPDVPKEEVVSVSLEPPPQDKEKPKPEPDKQLQLQMKPQPQPKDAPVPSASAPKPQEKKAEAKKAPENKAESKDSGKPPPPSENAPAKPAEEKPQALESGLKDETAPKDKEVPEPPPTETPAPDLQGALPSAAKAGPDKLANGDPQKKDAPAQPALPKDVTPPQTGLSPLLPTPDQTEKPQGGLVTEQRFALDEDSAKAPQQPASVPVPSAPSAEKSAGPVSSLKPAKRIYSKSTLSDPRVRQALGKLPPERRIVQICSIEMLEQIRRAVPGAVPDVIAPSPSTRQTITARLMDVSGAAFRSKGQWYDIGYHCETDAKTETITSFSYALGAPVPKSQWPARRFPTN